MSRSYTNLVQTGRANISVADTYGNIGDAQKLEFVNSNVFGVKSGNTIFIYNRIDDAGTPVQFYTASIGNLTLPVNITGNYNVPVYLDGTDVPANECWPYFQNTASTTDGWDANSTAMFQPYQSAFFASTNGTGDWYKVMQTSVSANIPSSIDRGFYANSALQIVANADTNVQCMTFMTTSVDPNVIVASTMNLQTIELKANCPQTVSSFFGYGFTGNAVSVLTLGVLVRNMEANTRAYFTAGALTPTYAF